MLWAQTQLQECMPWQQSGASVCCWWAGTCNVATGLVVALAASSLTAGPYYFSRYSDEFDRELDKRNFRRRMLSLGIIKPTGGTRMEGAHRPAQLFTFTRREPVTV